VPGQPSLKARSPLPTLGFFILTLTDGFTIRSHVRHWWGANWVAALYFGTDAVNIDTLAVKSLDDLTLASAIVRFRNVDSTDSLAGTWIGGTRFLLGTTVAQTLAMQVRVWDFNQFATFDEARTMGGYAMESAPFDYVINPSSDPASYKINNFQGITPPECVPEPSVFVLAIIGIGALLAWQRTNPRGRQLRLEQ